MEYPNQVHNHPVVSVCISAYNHASFISDCIEGVLNQEVDFPIEIIIGEDDSTDGTREICIHYAEKFPSLIRLFLRSEKDKIWINGKKTGNFNWLANLKAARGEYIALCDGDDYWIDPLKLKKQVDIINSGSFVLCGTHKQALHEGETNFREEYPRFSNRQEFSQIDFSLENPFLPSTVIFKNKFEIFPDWLNTVSILDWPLFFLLVKEGRAIFLDEPMTVYRVHAQGFWSSMGFYERLHNRVLVREKIIAHLPDLAAKVKLLKIQALEAKKMFRYKKQLKDLALFVKHTRVWVKYWLFLTLGRINLSLRNNV